MKSREIEKELQFHIDERTSELLAAGHPPEEARRQARLEFGGVLQVQEACRDADQRLLVRSFRLIESMFNDLRWALRGLARSRGFTTMVVLSLALGVGVNSAMFTAIDALLLRSIPARDPKELLLLKRSTAAGDQLRFSYPAYRYFRDNAHPVAAVGGITVPSRVRSPHQSQWQTETSTVTVQMVTGDFFATMGIEPQLGRLISNGDDRVPGSDPVAVLSDGYWNRHFASDPAVVGQSVTLNETPFTVIGVAPEQFYGVEPGAMPDVWVPTMMQSVIMDLPSLVEVPAFNWLYLFARPTADGMPAQTIVELRGLQGQFNQLRAQQVSSAEIRRNVLREQLEVMPATRGIRQLADNYRQPMVVLMFAVAIVLLISCLNLSMLALARTTRRTKEIAIRLAVGARPSQVIRYLMLESVALAVGGSVVGTIAGQKALTFAAAFIPPGPSRMPVVFDTAINHRTLLFSGGIVAAITCLFTIVPAVRVAKADLVSGLAGTMSFLRRREGVRSAPLRHFIIATQVSASVVLLICGGLFFETLRNLRSQDFGFDAQRATALQVALPRSYKAERVHAFAAGLLDRLTSAPGIEAATFGSPSLLSGYESRVLATGANDAAQAYPLESNAMTVAPNFFAVMKIPVVSGRTFGELDTAGAPPVAIISDSAAGMLFAGRPAVGQQIRVRTGDTAFGAPIEIIGVAADVHFKDLRSTPSPVIYTPLAQQKAGFADGFVVKTSLSTAALGQMLSRAVASLDSSAVLDRMEPYPQRISRWSERERVLASIAGVFGVLALLLACLGMYGITSMLVTDRRREIAIRLAIGSSLSRVIWLFVRESLLVATAGAAVGVVLALLIARVLATYFFHVAPLTSPGLWSALVFATVVPTVGSWLAVRQQARIEPASAVRTT